MGFVTFSHEKLKSGLKGEWISLQDRSETKNKKESKGEIFISGSVKTSSLPPIVELLRQSPERTELDLSNNKIKKGEVKMLFKEWKRALFCFTRTASS